MLLCDWSLSHTHSLSQNISPTTVCEACCLLNYTYSFSQHTHTQTDTHTHTHTHSVLCHCALHGNLVVQPLPSLTTIANTHTHTHTRTLILLWDGPGLAGSTFLFLFTALYQKIEYICEVSPTWHLMWTSPWYSKRETCCLSVELNRSDIWSNLNMLFVYFPWCPMLSYLPVGAPMLLLHYCYNNQVR